MSRVLKDWLDAYVAYADNSEPPKIYHPWVGVSMISAALQRKTYVSLGFETLFPNIYVVLIGPSGCRKSTALRIGVPILREVSNITVGAQATTREKLIQDMALAVKSYTDSTGIPVFHNSYTLVCSELQVFLRHKNIELLANMTDWYDCESPWENRTKNMGTDTIEGICLNMIAAMAPEWMPTAFPSESVGGGTTARMFFVVAFRKAISIPNPILTDAQLALKPKLIHDLQLINKIHGQYSKSPEAQAYYDEWYTSQDTNPPITHPKLASYCERRGAHIHKLSMIMSASRGDDKIVELSDMQRAIKFLEITEKPMAYAFSGFGDSKFVRETELIMRYMEVHGIATNRELVGKFFHDIDLHAFTIVIRSLAIMGKIRVTVQRDGTELYEYLSEDIKKQEKEKEEEI